MRALALDLGTSRVGVAVSDPAGVLASPHSVLPRGPDRAGLHRAIAALASELEVAVVVVGVPYRLDGGVGHAAQAALDEAAELAAALDVPVETADERFTTVSAHTALEASGHDSRARRERVDAAAAAVLLQAWLDRQRTVSAPSASPDE
jgi:putative Holliday junction resolvase